MDDGMELVSGWGRTPVTASYVARPSSPDELAKAGLDAGHRGVIPRGLGRAYGDAALTATRFSTMGWSMPSPSARRDHRREFRPATPPPGRRGKCLTNVSSAAE